MIKIWAHTLVKNEERYLWFAVVSVIDYVDKILLWDTGSTDKTIEIIKYLKRKYSNKIDFKEVGEVDPHKYTQVRQEMLNETASDWFIILDGDEVWWNDSINRVTKKIRTLGDNLDTIVSPYYNLVGDIYHYENENVGKYKIDRQRGHLTIRAINRNIKGLCTKNPHGSHGYYDGKGKLIQNLPKTRRKYVDSPYMHFSNLLRSSTRAFDRKVPKRNIKYKYHLGRLFEKDFYFPEAFFVNKPGIVPCPWYIAGKNYQLFSTIISPARFVKSKIVKERSGY